MKNWKYLKLMTLLLIGGGLVFTTSCGDDDGGEPEPPSITEITNEAGEPIQGAALSETIVIVGTSLSSVGTVTINDAEVTPSSVNDGSIILTIPTTVPTIATDPNVSNKLVVTIPGAGADGADLELSADFNVSPGSPVIDYISNEFAPAGDEITIEGSLFYFVEDVVFPGEVSATSFTVVDAETITAIVPSGVVEEEGGEITIITQGSVGGSAPKHTFYDRSQIIADFDEHNFWSFWGGDASTPEEGGFDGNFWRLDTDNSVGANFWWDADLTFAIVPNDDSTGITPQNLSGSADQYVLRFEMNIPAGQPWTSGWLELQWQNGSGDTEGWYGRLKPWNVNPEGDGEWWEPTGGSVDDGEDGEFVVFHTDGEWITYDYPLSYFGGKETSDDNPDCGKGNPCFNQLTDISDIITEEGNVMGLLFALQNPGPEMPAGFNVSFDNFRLVKITE